MFLLGFLMKINQISNLIASFTLLELDIVQSIIMANKFQ